jgi:uncharacterized protein YbjT (DUF2867 family)
LSRGVLAITGGTGFVGKTLVGQALAAGYQVRALTRKARPLVENVVWVEGSLDDPASLLRLARGSDAVVHVAGVVNAPDRAAFEAGNVTGTMNIVQAAKQEGVDRFIHVSSLAAREPELSNYGWSKAKAERIVGMSGLDWTMVRPPAIYGPGDRDMLDLFKMAKLGFVLLPPSGRTSLIEVSDLARLLLALVPSQAGTTQIYEADDGRDGGWSHVGFGAAIGWAFAKRVATIPMPRAVLNFGAKADRLMRGSKAKLTHDRVSYFCHSDWVIDPLKRPPAHLWKPTVNTRDGLKATAASYRKAGWL